MIPHPESETMKGAVVRTARSSGGAAFLPIAPAIHRSLSPASLAVGMTSSFKALASGSAVSMVRSSGLE